MNPRRTSALYHAVLALPAAAVAFVVLATARDVWNVRNADPSDMYLAVASEQGRAVSFPLPGGILVRRPGAPLVYVLGESSLLISDGETFPHYLGELRDDVQVVNLGVNGISSPSVRQRMTEALGVARPDLVVLYFGHNDYNIAYQKIVVPRFYDSFHVLLRLSHLLAFGRPRPEVLLSDSYYWHARVMRPRLLQLFERLGLIDIRQEQFEPINAFVLETFIANASAILDLAAREDIPVVFVTPIGNVRAEPFGDLDSTTRLYVQGMLERDYPRSLRLLEEARDKELFTYDIRAKTPLLDFIRSLRRPGVHILDLEERLEERRFEFGYSNFLDYFHFNDGTHRVVAGLISDFIEERRLLEAKPTGRAP